jgi:hypothetical protein
MRVWAGIALCIGILLGTHATLADTIYKYRNKSTGRDVFVNRLDQVPRKYRSQAKIVVESADGPAEAAEEPPAETAESPAKPARETVPISTPVSTVGDDLRQALSGKNLWKNGPSLASAAIDARLVTAGTRPLTGSERADLGSLLIAMVIASIVAGLAALIVWIVIIVTAVRDGRLWWAALIFLFWPLGYVYLFLYAGKGRALFKTVCAVGMLSPALVGLVGAWRFYAWFHAVIQARGGHL